MPDDTPVRGDVGDVEALPFCGVEMIRWFADLLSSGISRCRHISEPLHSSAPDKAHDVKEPDPWPNAAERAAASVRDWVNCADRRRIQRELPAMRRDLVEATALTETVDDKLRVASSWMPVNLAEAVSALGSAESIARTSQEWIFIALFRHNYHWLKSHSPNPKAPPWSFAAQSELAAAIRSSMDHAEGVASRTDDWLACAKAWDDLLAPCTNTVQGFVKGFLGDRDGEVDRCLASAKALALTEAEKDQCRRADVDLFPMREARRLWREREAKHSETGVASTEGQPCESASPDR